MNISKQSNDVLTENELIEMSEIMSSAFVNHLNFKMMIDSPIRREKALYHLFYMMFKVINKAGYIYVMKDEKPIGYITFMDAFDQKQISFGRVIKTGGLWHFIRFVLSLKAREIGQFLRYMKTYNSYHGHQDTDATIHLYSTGIKESHRSKGWFSKSFLETVTYFKNKGYQKMILETSDESNCPIYEALGFVLKEQLKLEKSTQCIYFFELKIQ